MAVINSRGLLLLLIFACQGRFKLTSAVILHVCTVEWREAVISKVTAVIYNHLLLKHPQLRHCTVAAKHDILSLTLVALLLIIIKKKRFIITVSLI